MQPVVSLAGRTLVVTGAGQGIGRAIAELGVALGANIVALDRNGEALQAAMTPLPRDRVLSLVGMSIKDARIARAAHS